ncbi:MAG: hypothetical protein ACFCA4_01235 [Cyanophyceae cyanobacterium]
MATKKVFGFALILLFKAAILWCLLMTWMAGEVIYPYRSSSTRGLLLLWKQVDQDALAVLIFISLVGTILSIFELLIFFDKRKKSKILRVKRLLTAILSISVLQLSFFTYCHISALAFSSKLVSCDQVTEQVPGCYIEK